MFNALKDNHENLHIGEFCGISLLYNCSKALTVICRLASPVYAQSSRAELAWWT